MNVPSMIRTATTAALLAAAVPAMAAIDFGSTTGAPTYHRALEGAPPTDLSAVGTDVAYDAYTFSVTADGDYRFISVALRGWDNFLFLYQNAFDPSDALDGVLVGDDDLNRIGLSGFTHALTTGVAYVLVTTSFYNEDSGSFLNLIRGPGDVVPGIPEPGTYALLALGLLAVIVAVRRRTNDARDL